MFRKISILMLLASSVSFGAHYHPPHTDGIEPYYQQKDFAKWGETVPEDLRPYLSASNPEKKCNNSYKSCAVGKKRSGLQR